MWLTLINLLCWYLFFVKYLLILVCLFIDNSLTLCTYQFCTLFVEFLHLHKLLTLAFYGKSILLWTYLKKKLIEVSFYKWNLKTTFIRTFFFFSRLFGWKLFSYWNSNHKNYFKGIAKNWLTIILQFEYFLWETIHCCWFCFKLSNMGCALKK